SPKDQFHMVGLLRDVSLNWTASGAFPLVRFAVNEATGAGCGGSRIRVTAMVLSTSKRVEFVSPAFSAWNRNGVWKSSVVLFLAYSFSAKRGTVPRLSVVPENTVDPVVFFTVT